MSSLTHLLLAKHKLLYIVHSKRNLSTTKIVFHALIQLFLWNLIFY